MTDPNDFVRCPAGYHFGVIDDSVAEAIGRPAGPICLPYGVPGAKGFGQQHIEQYPSRMARIQWFDFSTFVDYAYFICQHYEWIADGQDGRLVLVRSKDGYHHVVIVQHNGTQSLWTITTGIPKRVHRGEKLWERVQAGRSEPSPGDVENRPRREILTLSKSSKLDDNGS